MTSLRLITVRLWPWQRSAATRQGWFVRKGLFRPIAAMFFDVGQVVPEVGDGVDGGLSPLAVDLSGNSVGNPKTRGRVARTLQDFAHSLDASRSLQNLAQGFVRKGMKPIHYSSGKLALNKLLQLRGHEPIPHEIDPDLNARLNARIQAQRKAGA